MYSQTHSGADPSAAPTDRAAWDPLGLAFLGDTSSIHFQRWVNFMAARGHRVTLLVAADKPVGQGLHPAIAVQRFRPYYGHRFWPAGVLSARLSLRRVLASIQPDVLNAHYLTVHGYHAWLSGFRPYTLSLWGSDVLVTPRKSRLHAVLSRLALRGARTVTVNSPQLEIGAKEFGARPGAIEMVQWGVDLAAFRPDVDANELRSRLGLTGKRVVFSPRGVGALYRPELALAALAQLPADVALVMTGQGGGPGEYERIRGRIEELGLGDRTVLLPGIDHAEMPVYMALADVMVSLPASDSTSVAILEALATGRQVVAAELPGTRAWLADLEPSLLVPVDDLNATVEALLRALDRTPAEKDDLARRAREIVEARADQEVTLAHIEDIYRRVVAESRRRG